MINLGDIVQVVKLYTLEEYLLEYCFGYVLKHKDKFYLVTDDEVEIYDNVEALCNVMYGDEPDELEILKDENSWFIPTEINEVLTEYGFKVYTF